MNKRVRLENAASCKKCYETGSRRIHGLMFEGRSEVNRVERETELWVLIVQRRRRKCNVDSYAVCKAH